MRAKLHCLSNRDEMTPVVWGLKVGAMADLCKHAMNFVGPPTKVNWQLRQDLASEEAAWQRSKEEGLAMALERILKVC